MPLPHVELAGVDPYRVVHDAVEDGVSDGVTDETAVSSPIANWVANAVLGVVRSAAHELEQEPSEPLVGLVHEPFADREQHVRRVFMVK